MAVDMADSVAAGNLSPVVGIFRLAAEHRLHRSIAPQGGKHGVISVEHHQAVLLADVGQQLALGLEDVLPAAQLFDVGVTDVGDDSHLGSHDIAEVVDLPRLIHAHLQHAHLVGVVQTQQGQGQANVVIKLPSSSAPCT